MNTIMIIDVVTRFKNHFFGPQNAVDVQLLVNHPKEQLTKFNLLVLFGVFNGMDKMWMV